MTIKLKSGEYYMDGCGEIIGPMEVFYDMFVSNVSEWTYDSNGTAYMFNTNNPVQFRNIVKHLPFGTLEEIGATVGDEVYFMVWDDGETYEESVYKSPMRKCTVNSDGNPESSDGCYWHGRLANKYLLLNKAGEKLEPVPETDVVPSYVNEEEEIFVATGHYTPKGDKPKSNYVFEVHFPKVNGHPDWSRAVVKGR